MWLQSLPKQVTLQNCLLVCLLSEFYQCLLPEFWGRHTNFCELLCRAVLSHGLNGKPSLQLYGPIIIEQKDVALSYRMPRYPQVSHKLLCVEPLEKGSQEYLQSLRKKAKIANTRMFTQPSGSTTQIKKRGREHSSTSTHQTRPAGLLAPQLPSQNLPISPLLLCICWPEAGSPAVGMTQQNTGWRFHSHVLFVVSLNQKGRRKKKETTTRTSLQKPSDICNPPLPSIQSETDRPRENLFKWKIITKIETLHRTLHERLVVDGMVLTS